MSKHDRIIIGITGASGSIYAIRLLEVLQSIDIETHLVVSKWGMQTIQHEMGIKYENVTQLADYCYGPNDQGAAISSGSFRVSAMIIIPCSMNTVAAISNGMGSNLVQRAADVIIKENKKLVIAPRESPLSAIHLRNLLRLSELGSSIIPLMPAFYNHPQSINDLVNHVVARVLDQVNITCSLSQRWDGKLSSINT